MIIFLMQQLLHFNLRQRCWLVRDWYLQEKRRQYHAIRYHCFDLHLVFAHAFYMSFIPLKRSTQCKCIRFLRRRHLLPFDTRRFLKREEILTHHISNSMLNLIHERNTQHLDKHNSFTLLQIKTERNGTTWEYGTIFLMSWMRLLWFCMVNYYCL